MFTVLSTKILTPSQRELLLNTNIGLVEYNFIAIEPLHFSIEDRFDHLIFTSQNAIKSYTKNQTPEKTNKYKAFCVGSKSRALLEDLGFTVLEEAPNAELLAQIIVKKHPKQSFLFLSGDKRRDELPFLLEKNNIRYNEIVVYKTLMRPKAFDRVFDGLLFFSPSAVESFAQHNSFDKTIGFCIGGTTASTLKKYTDKFIIANKPTIENVLVQVVNYSKKHDQERFIS